MLISINDLKEKYDTNIRGVIHFGAHQAEELIPYKEAGINKVIWFEANPQLSNTVKDIVLSHGADHKVFQGLMSDTDNEECSFYITNNGQSSSMLKLAKHASYYPEIVVTDTIHLKTKRFDTLASEEKIDMAQYNFLNIDVQGAELKVIKGFGELIKHIDYIYAEVNVEELYDGCALMSEIDEYLIQYGFERVETQMTDKSWGDAFYMKKAIKTQIVMHIMPGDIVSNDSKFNMSGMDINVDMVKDIFYKRPYVRSMLSLINSFVHLTKEEIDSIEFYITLNISKFIFEYTTADYGIIMSEEFKKTNDFFQRRVEEYVKKKFNQSTSFKIKSNVIDNHVFYGTTAQKRDVIKLSGNDIKTFIFLDSDIYFHQYTLKYLLYAANIITDKYYIICPQTIKLWDETWDIITNEKFMLENNEFYKQFEPANVYSQQITDINLVEIPTFKFGCGWFTLYSASLWKFVNIPEELGPYGSEDTFLMYASSMMKDKGYNVKQYILEGLYIAEDYKYKNEFTDDSVKQRAEYKKSNIYVKHDTPIFSSCISAFKNKLDTIEWLSDSEKNKIKG